MVSSSLDIIDGRGIGWLWLSFLFTDTPSSSLDIFTLTPSPTASLLRWSRCNRAGFRKVRTGALVFIAECEPFCAMQAESSVFHAVSFVSLQQRASRSLLVLLRRHMRR